MAASRICRRCGNARSRHAGYRGPAGGPGRRRLGRRLYAAHRSAADADRTTGPPPDVGEHPRRPDRHGHGFGFRLGRIGARTGPPLSAGAGRRLRTLARAVAGLAPVAGIQAIAQPMPALERFSSGTVARGGADRLLPDTAGHGRTGAAPGPAPRPGRAGVEQHLRPARLARRCHLSRRRHLRSPVFLYRMPDSLPDGPLPMP